MIGRQGENFSNLTLHFAASLRGTRQNWLRQRSRLLAMVDTLGMPTFFTRTGTVKNVTTNQSNATIENPALADWLFYYCVVKFVEVFYVDILGATDYWFHFEWQHRGSPHMHGLAWLNNAPNVFDFIDECSTSRKKSFLRLLIP